MATSARIDELRKKFDENPRRYFAPLANEYRKAGDLEQAVFICEEYLPQQPGHMSGHIVYGQALFELGRFDEARTVFETALSLDPENLIALRHLGDIARQAGDAHTARIWYQRVLEADPRNEEIAQLMMSLLSTPASTSVVDHNAPTPLSNPAVPVSPTARTSTPSTPVPAEAEGDAATAEAPRDTETPRVTSPSLTPISATPATPQSFVSRHAPKEEDLLDLDNFDLGGIPLSSLRSAKTEDEHDAEGLAPADEGLSALDATTDDIAVGDDAFVENDFEPYVPRASVSGEAMAPRHEDIEPVEIEKAAEFTADEFEQDPYAIAAKPLTDGEPESFIDEPPATIELAADIGLGLPDDGGSSSTFGAGDDGVDGLETFEEGVITGRSSLADEATSLSTESFYDTADEEGIHSFVDDSRAMLGATHPVSPADEAPHDALADLASIETNFAGPDAGETEEPPSFVSQQDELTHDELTHDQFDDAPSALHTEEAAPDVMAVDSAETDAADSEFDSPQFDSPQFDTPKFERAIDLHAPPPLPTPRFHEALPASLQGDPLMTPAFGAIEPIAESSFAPEAETHFAQDPAAPTPDPDPFGAHELEPEFASSIDDTTADEAIPDVMASEVATADVAEGSAHVPGGEPEGAGAFVTETMATLYLEQGHYDAAIDIYRQLVQQRPDDIALRDRLHAAEERAWGHERELGASMLVDESDTPADFDSVVAPAARSYGGPTIRDFLTGVFHRPTATVEEVPSAVDEEPLVGEAQHEEASEEQPQAPAENAEFPETVGSADADSAHAGATAPSSGDSVGASLGVLFSGAGSTETDEVPRIESPLGGRVATPTTGAPAHRAASELSLDHVFKANSGRSPNPAFSFDQFFSQEAAEQASPSPEAPSEPRGDSTDDIAQFNAWLNGLKKS